MMALRLQLQKSARMYRQFSVLSRPMQLCHDALMMHHEGGTIPEVNKTIVQARFFSSYGSSSPVKRAFPQYNVYGPNAMMSIKLMSPSFKFLRGEILVLDQNKKGRILLEFTPRSPDGSYIWNDQVRFGLSPEEVGLFCSQLPQFGIELSRSPSNYQMADSEEAQYGMHSDMPDKVLKVEPGEGATVSFTIDHVKDGIGGQSPGPGQGGGGAPMHVTVQAGEFEVIASLMKTSIPTLLGWPTLVEMSVKWSVEDAIQGGGRYGGGSGGGGGIPRYSGGSEVPF